MENNKYVTCIMGYIKGRFATLYDEAYDNDDYEGMKLYEEAMKQSENLESLIACLEAEGLM